MAASSLSSKKMNRNPPEDEIPRIIHLESRVDRVESDVSEIKQGVKTLLSRPQNPGYTQIIATLFSTLGALGLIFAFAEWRLAEAVHPINALAAELKAERSEFTTRLRIIEVNNAVLSERIKPHP